MYRNGALAFDERRIESRFDYLIEIRELFVQHLLAAVDELPPIPWAGTSS